MATMVSDAHALMVLFNDEPGAEEVEKILLKAEKGNPRLLMSVIKCAAHRRRLPTLKHTRSRV